MRADIQALRAAAVAMVLAFHLWPHRFAGGFGGVDVFFVISGFLITGSLLSDKWLEAFRESKSSALSAFWLRRIRRLLPMALLVIFATVIGSWLIVPAAARSEFTLDALASIFYFENFKLAISESDYFAASAANPFQHYWSLAVEEQFYLVWPVLLGALFFAGKKRFSVAVLGVVVAASFAFSIWQSHTDASFAYFNTLTRVWQFGLGALLAVGALGTDGVATTLSKVGAMRTSDQLLSPRARVGVATVGFAAIALSTFWLDERLPFPGWQALLPTLGAGAVIWAKADLSFATDWPGPVGAVSRLFSRPVIWLGDISYSLYLWHWPVIILAGYALGRQLSNFELVAVLVLCLGLAWASKRLVEDRIRHSQKIRELPSSRQFAVAAAASVLCAGAALGAGLAAQASVAEQQQKLVTAEASECFGARSVGKADCAPVANQDVVPTLDFAKRDAADAGSVCMVKALETEPNFCRITEGGVRVLLIGDSHAATHLGALKILAEDRGWALDLSYHAGCSFSLVERNKEERGLACAKWNELVSAQLATAEPYDIVFTASYARNRLADLPGVTDEVLARGFVAAYTPLLERGSKLYVIRDNPEMDAAMKECFETAVRDATMCSMNVTNAFVGDAAVSAAFSLGAELGAGAASTGGSTGPYAKQINILDFTDVYCPGGICAASVGGVYVYRNADHISATFSRSMDEVFAARLK